jgi:hypothetical protein
MLKNIIALLVALLFLTMPYHHIVSSQMVDSNIIGGLGGMPFNDSPSLGHSISSVKIRAGVFVDSIHVSYNPPNNIPPKEPHGGNGGSEYVFFLNNGEYITGISGRHGKFIDALRIHTNYRVSPLYGGPGGVPFNLYAPNNYHIIGFYGRSGSYLDAIGIIIAPK